MVEVENTHTSDRQEAEARPKIRNSYEYLSNPEPPFEALGWMFTQDSKHIAIGY